MSKADDTTMETLHGELALVLAKAIHEKEPKIVELPDAESDTGKRKETIMVRNAAVLNVARQFLKDNNISGAVRPGNPLSALQRAASDLPSFAGDDADEGGDPTPLDKRCH